MSNVYENVKSTVVERVELNPVRPPNAERRRGFYYVSVRTHRSVLYYSNEFPLTESGRQAALDLARRIQEEGTINPGEWRRTAPDESLRYENYIGVRSDSWERVRA